MSDFVLEIGTEELPARFLAGLERELAERFGSALGEAGYEGWALHAFSTPRRAVVQIEGLAETQPEREELVSGPPVKAAFDAQGKPTRAAEGFARTLGLDVTALTRMQTAKGEYVAGVKKTGGGATLDALAALCPSVIAALPFAKRMRWGEGSFAYARPIRWILALFGDAVVSFEIGGVSSGRMTYGHRVMGAGPFEVPTAGDYLEIIRDNKPMQRLMVAGAGCKLALAIATNTTVLLALYGILMGNYNSLYLPMMVLGYVCAVPFFLLSMRTSQKLGQRASLIRYVSVALVCYAGVLALLLLSDHGNPARMLVFPFQGGGAVNLYTVLFIVCFGVGYGAYYATADMPIPMVADCSDYETYRSGKYIPGIMGTLFSLVDKLVSSLAQTLVAFIFLACAGLSDLPTDSTPYSGGIKAAVIVMFCVIPMLAWAATLLAMKGYTLTGEKMKTIQAVNAARREAVAGGMSLEQAMKSITDDTVKTEA